MQDHPLRQVLNDELHGRAGMPLTAPAWITHFAFTLKSTDEDPVLHLQELGEALPQPQPQPGTLHHAIALQGGFLRFERHGEFYRISAVASGKRPAGFEAVNLLPQAWVEDLPGERMVAIHTHVLASQPRTPNLRMVRQMFDHDDLAASAVSEGLATIWTDFRIRDGFSRVLVQDHGLTPLRLGRVVRRIHEIETYRMMALLALPVARAAQTQLQSLEPELAKTVKRMAAAQSPEDDAALLNSLSRIARDVEHLSNTASYRFAAARAYANLVDRRIAELGERRVQNYQRIGVFLDRRFRPAMATCQAVSERIESLASRGERAANLLRTRVDIELEAQNQTLLRSMDKRARQQLQLQETVEGLSVVAISYYLIGIVIKFMESLAAALPWLDMKLVTLIVVPLTVLLVWLALRRLRKKFSASRS